MGIMSLPPRSLLSSAPRVKDPEIIKFFIMSQSLSLFMIGFNGEEPCNFATPYATSNEATKRHPAQGSREVIPSNGKWVPFDIAIHIAKEGVKGGKKRFKQHPQGATSTTNHDDSNYGKEDSSGMGCITTATDDNKH
jgi:hypothetical protein